MEQAAAEHALPSFSPEWEGIEPLSGWEELGNTQLLVLWLQLQVQGYQEAKEAQGIPRFPDLIVLVGLQVEGCAPLAQKAPQTGRRSTTGL